MLANIAYKPFGDFKETILFALIAFCKSRRVYSNRVEVA